MQKALYREFRPERFEEIIGQDHIVRILQSQIASGTVHHAYLFCGTRGTGKTTIARILAKALNCTGDGSEKPCCTCESCRAVRDGSHIDVIEIDAASNNGVDDIRELRENVNYPPVTGKYKIYIIDEVHQLSTSAFNALLKTLEEPPEYVMFIMATTEPRKIPATILSRCVRLNFRRVSEEQLIFNMKRICEARGVQADDDALALIAVNADGSVRDSLSILDQCMNPGETLTREQAASILGTAGESALLDLTGHLLRGETAQGLIVLDRMLASGIDVRQLMKDWLEHFRNLLLIRFFDSGSPQDDTALRLNMSREHASRMAVQSGEISQEDLGRWIRSLTRVISESRWAPRPRVMLELFAVEMSQPQEGLQSTARPLPKQQPALHQTESPAPAPPAPVRSQPHQAVMNPGGEQQSFAAPASLYSEPSTDAPPAEAAAQTAPDAASAADLEPEHRSRSADPLQGQLPQDAMFEEIPPWEDLPVPSETLQNSDFQQRPESLPHWEFQQPPESRQQPDYPQPPHGKNPASRNEDTPAEPAEEQPAEPAPLQRSEHAGSVTGGFSPEDWDPLMERVATVQGRGSFNLLKGRTRVHHIDRERIVIECDSKHVENHLRDSAIPILEEELQRSTGMRYIIITTVNSSGAASPEHTSGEKKQELEHFFGHEVILK